MKTILLFCLLFGVSAFAANPVFQSFDTNNFVYSAAANYIRANTNPANPNALVSQAQLGASTGATNGQTLAQVIAIINTNAIIQNKGLGTNTTLNGGTNFGTFSITGSGTPSTMGSTFGSGHVTLTVTPGNSSGTVSVNGNLATAGNITDQGLTASTIISADANNQLASVANAAGVMTNDGAGVVGFGPLPASSVSGLLTTTNLSPNTYASFDGNTWLTSTRNGINWTNLITPPAAGDTNFVVEYPDGSIAPFSFTNLISIIARGQTNLSAGTLNATNANGSNFLGGQNWFTNNVAPIVPIATTGSGGSTFTNTLGTRAMLSVPYYLQFSLTGSPCGTFSNRTTGEKYIIGGGVMTNQFITNMIMLPPCSPGDVWDGRNESVGTSVTFGLPNIGSAAKWYPVN